MAKPVILTTVGHYLPGFKAGGIISCVANIVNHLHHDFDFRIVTRDRDLGDTGPFPRLTPGAWQKTGNAQVRYLPPGEDSARRLRNLLAETPHDLIYLNSFFDPLSVKVLLNRKLGLLGRAPILLCPQGEFAAPSLSQKHLKKAVFLRFARLFGLYGPVMWHASSPAEASDIATVMGVAGNRIRMASQLPPIVDDESAETPVAPVPAKSGGLRVVFLSRISPEKNLDFALKVLRKVQVKVDFDIIGPIEKVDYWAQCEVLLKELPSHVVARSLGPVKSTDVLRTLRNYDLMFFPSSSESYGQVIAESLTSGTQVLISTNTPWRDLESKGLGWDLPLDNPDSFVRVIEAVGSRDAAARGLTRKATMEAMKRFSAESSAVKDIRNLFTTTILNKTGCGTISAPVMSEL